MKINAFLLCRVSVFPVVGKSLQLIFIALGTYKNMKVLFLTLV